MGVYISGMEMPTSCGFCVFEQENGDGCECYVNGCLTEYQKRPDDCPLVPVQPHGRLGDLDELARKIEHDRYNHTHTDGLAARHHIAEYGHFLNAIAVAPTIIPADEPFGKSEQLNV